MKVLSLAVVGALLAGCTALPELALRDASDPGLEAAPVSYRSVIGDYEVRRPVDPQSWQQLNRQVAPGGATQ